MNIYLVLGIIIQYYVLYFVQSIPALAIGNFFQFASVSLWQTHINVDILFLFCHHNFSKLILYSSCSGSRISPYCQKSLDILLEGILETKI